MSASTFQAASETAERWAVRLADIGYMAKRGNVEAAYALLWQLSDELEQNASLLDASRDELAAVSDAVVKHDGVLGSQSYSSAHEAVTDMAKLAVLGLLGPLERITDLATWRPAAERLLIERCDGLTLSSGESSDLQARITKRAKLIRAKPDSGPEPKSKPAEPPKLEAVWLGNGKVRIGAETLSLETQLANVLQALVELRAATKPELQKRSGMDEPDRLLRRLVKRFPVLEPYILRPGGRGKGGYRTTITDESPKRPLQQ